MRPRLQPHRGQQVRANRARRRLFRAALRNEGGGLPGRDDRVGSGPDRHDRHHHAGTADASAREHALDDLLLVHRVAGRRGRRHGIGSDFHAASAGHRQQRVPRQHVPLHAQPAMLVQFRFRAGQRGLIQERLQVAPEAGAIADRDERARLGVHRVVTEFRGRLVFGYQRSAELGLDVPVLGVELVALRPDLVGQRVALQPGDLIEPLADLGRAHGKPL
ncbi:MAG: hypothetical protein F4018_12950 [Acidobacteria bacterium]|nr:hypothetical protein [Acidobacteriota bacterium]